MSRETSPSITAGGEPDDLASEAPDPFAALTGSDLERRLERALHALPVLYREVVMLVGIEGIGMEEVARILGLSHVTARKRPSRARAMLRAAFEDLPPPPPASGGDR